MQERAVPRKGIGEGGRGLRSVSAASPLVRSHGGQQQQEPCSGCGSAGSRLVPAPPARGCCVACENALREVVASAASRLAVDAAAGRQKLVCTPVGISFAPIAVQHADPVLPMRALASRRPRLLLLDTREKGQKRQGCDFGCRRAIWQAHRPSRPGAARGIGYAASQHTA